jgi:glycosyltransferase involved in cell wall biosynthesis
MRRNFDLVAVARLRSILRRERVDILNTHSSIDAWLGGMAAKLTGVRLVRTRHVSKRVRAHAFNAVHRWPAITITTGELLRRHFIADVGVADDRVVSIPTGVDVERFAPASDDRARTQLRQQLGLPAEARIVATVAVLRRAKRHVVLLDATARLSHQPEIYLVFAGEGSQREPILAEARRLGLAERVILLGHVEDVRPLLAGADLVASASAGMEGVPQALMQALAMARPVVATDDGAVGELILNQQTGLLVDRERPDLLAAAMARMLSDTDLANACGERGRAHVLAKYSQTAMIDAVEAAYRRAITP